MSEKKQNTVEKPKVETTVTLMDLVETYSADQDTFSYDQDYLSPACSTMTLADLIARIEKRNGNSHSTYHIHLDTCTVNNYHTTDTNTGENSLLMFLAKIAPLMVKDSSITAADFMSAVCKELPLMVKDSSITFMELFVVMFLVREKLMASDK